MGVTEKAQDIWKVLLFSLIGIICGTLLSFLLTSSGKSNFTYEVIRLEEQVKSLQNDVNKIEGHITYDDGRIDSLERANDPPKKKK